MELEIRTLVTNDRLRDLLRRNGSPTSGNKDRLTYRVAALLILHHDPKTATADLGSFEIPDRSLINHCLGCVRTWREETKEAAAAKMKFRVMIIETSDRFMNETDHTVEVEADSKTHAGVLARKVLHQKHGVDECEWATRFKVLKVTEMTC